MLIIFIMYKCIIHVNNLFICLIPYNMSILVSYLLTVILSIGCKSYTKIKLKKSG